MPQRVSFSSYLPIHLLRRRRRRRRTVEEPSQRRCDEFGYALGRAPSPYPRGRYVSWTSSETAGGGDDDEEEEEEEEEGGGDEEGNRLRLIAPPAPFPETRHVAWATAAGEAGDGSGSETEIGHKLERVPTPYPTSANNGGRNQSVKSENGCGMKGCVQRFCSRLWRKRGANDLHCCPGIGVWEGSTEEEGLELEDVMAWREGVLRRREEESGRVEEGGRVEEVVQSVMNGSRGRF